MHPTISLVSKPSRGVDHLVVGFGAEGLIGLPAATAKAIGKAHGDLAGLATELGAKPTLGHVAALPGAGGVRLLVVGLGQDELSPDTARRVGGDLARALSARLEDGAAATVAVSLGLDEPELVQSLGEGVLLGGYRYAKPGEEAGARISSVEIVTELKDAALSARIDSTARAVIAARDWVNTPPNVLYPETFAAAAQAHLTGSGVAVEVLDDAQLAALGYGGLTAVGGGSSRGPRLVRMTWRPRGARAHLALVGKGITFDSGGLNLKPGDSMLTMKCDMAGAAAVIAAMGAIAAQNLDVQVTGYAALAENLPSATAYRASDVLTIYGGTTVENMNTDAEGRLVMADAIARANEDAPDLIVDIATLTGACMVALGDRTGGLFGSEEATVEALAAAAEAAGEPFWPLPIPAHIVEGLDSKVADLRSTTGSRAGGALAAAAFLHRFVADERAWGHLDIAGPGYHDGAAYAHVTPGGTGFGVATLIELARGMAS